MAKVELKKPVVEEIKAALDGAKAAVVVDHRGLTVEQDTQLRKTLREAGVSYKITQKRYIVPTLIFRFQCVRKICRWSTL